MDPVHGGGPWTRGPCFVLSPANLTQCISKVKGSPWIVECYNVNLPSGDPSGSTSGREVKQVKLYLHLPCAQERQKSKFVPRLYFLIVGTCCGLMQWQLKSSFSTWHRAHNCDKSILYQVSHLNSLRCRQTKPRYSPGFSSGHWMVNSSHKWPKSLAIT